MPSFFPPTQKLWPGMKGSVMCPRTDSVCNQTSLEHTASQALRSRQHHAVHGKGQAKDNIAALGLTVQAKGLQARAASNVQTSVAAKP